MYSARVLLCTVSLTLLAAPVATAADPARHDLSSAWKVVVERLDLNQNQSIEVEELAVRLQQLAQQVDTDRDGRISRAELQQAAEQVRQVAGDRLRAAAREGRSRNVSIAELEQGVHHALSRVDTDQNGDLTGAEAEQALHAAADAAQRHIAAHLEQHHAKVASTIAKCRAEGERALAAVSEQIETARPEELVADVAISKLDSNGDQLLQAEELQARGEQLFRLADANHDGALTEAELQQATVAAANFIRQRAEERIEKALKRLAAK